MPFTWQSSFLFYSGLGQRHYHPHTFYDSISLVDGLFGSLRVVWSIQKKKNVKNIKRKGLIMLRWKFQQKCNQVNTKENINYKNRSDSKRKYRKMFLHIGTYFNHVPSVWGEIDHDRSAVRESNITYSLYYFEPYNYSFTNI